MLQTTIEFPRIAWKAKYQVGCDNARAAMLTALQRNNKPNGLKNLRCFPDCGPDHKATGFCGLPIDVKVTVSPPRDLTVLGELSLADAPRFMEGHVFSLDEIEPILRAYEDPGPELIKVQPLLRAIRLSEADGYRFDLCKKVVGWHYGWVGSKHTSDLEHAFCVYVCAPYGPDVDKVQVIGVFRSPRFTMFCRRRHNTVALEEKVARARPLDPAECVVALPLLPDGTIPSTGPPAALPPRNAAKAAAAPRKEVSSSAKKRSAPSASATSASAKKRASKSPRDAAVSKTSTPPGSARAVDDKLVRVLSAIAKLDELQRHETKRLVQKTEDFSWMEPITELFVGAELFDDVADIFNLDTLVDLDPPRSRAVEVITALAQFFVTETEITDAIHSHKLGSFQGFLDVVAREISKFLRDRFNGMTIDNLDALLRGEDYLLQSKVLRSVPTMKSAFDTLVSAAVSRAPSPEPSSASAYAAAAAATAAAATTSPQRSPPLTPASVASQKLAGQRVITDLSELDHILPRGITLKLLMRPSPLPEGVPPPDVAGTWLRPEDATADMEKMREKRDVDWVQRQLLAQMEKRFDLIQDPAHPLDVVVHLARKLLSPGIVKYRLDAVLRPFQMTSPLGNTPAAKSAQAWAVGPVCVFRNGYNDNERMYRCNWKASDGNLNSIHIYESLGGLGFGGSGVPGVPADEWAINRILLVWNTPCIRGSI